MTLHITSATPDDAPAIVEYNIALAIDTESKTLDRATVQAGVKAVLSDPSKGRYFVAQERRRSRCRDRSTHGDL